MIKNSREKIKEDITVKEIKKIYDLMVKSNLLEIELDEKKYKIKIKRKSEKSNKEERVVVKENNALAGIDLTASSLEQKKIKEMETIKASIPGVFYESPSPDSPPFVEVNGIVEKGETICIVEAMKVMNEIQAEKKCKIIKILVKNGKSVQQGEDLFFVSYL
ncbi:acetyl-CoA carboxylase, biotin carboxyl carrier protein [bacterium]|nr:acetyl-CoA carboxylase, biotin carboxyl carrier protein [bacterium]